MKKICKSVLSIMLSLMVVIGVVSPTVSAANEMYFKEHKGDSDMWLVDANTKKTASTIYLYGRADYICLKIKKESGYYASFYFEMYSDSKYKKEVASYSTKSTAGTNYETLPISFDDLKSGTYYVKTYVYKETFRSNYYYTETSVDPETERTYKIVINKKGTDIDDMNTVMYGYENTEKGPRVYWYSVPGATGYYVYRKSPKTGKYSKIKTVKDSGDKFIGYTDSTYKGENATRYYKVVAYKGSLKTPMSLKALKVTALKTPTVKAEVISNNRIKVSWSKVKSNASYTVFYRHNDSDTWKEAGTVSKKLSYVIDAKKFENGDIYRFTVIATVDGIPSGYNTKGVARRFLEYPELKACTYPADGGITVNWKSVSGADGYMIYRKQKTSADWVVIGEVSGRTTTEYTDLTATNKDYYYYTVRSMYKGVNGSLYNSGEAGTILSAPVLNEITEDGGQSIKISWKKIPNDCKYVVMRKTTDGWENVKTTTENYYKYDLNSRISSETFTVRATRGSFSSDFDKVGVSYTAYPEVVVSDMEVTSEGVSLKWKKPVNAENSVVYKKIDDGEYSVLADIEGSSIVDDSIEVGVKYTYKIAYKYNDEVIESAAIEQPLCLNTDVVERESVAYNTISESSGYKKFTTKIKDFDAEAQYRVYHLTDAGWVRFNTTPNSDGEISVKSNTFSDVESFAIVKITPQGDYTFITEPDFTVEFTSEYIPVALVSGGVENGYPTIVWDVDSAKTADNIHIYRKAPDSKNKYKLVAVVPATETTFVDESAKQNCFYDYQLRIEKDGFVTSGGPVVQVNYMGAPELVICNLKGKVHLGWNDVSHAVKYEIYKKLPNEENWTKIKTTEDTYYSYKGSEKFVGYLYMVKAIDTNGDEGPAAISEEWKYVPSVANFEAKHSSGVNKLSWSAVSGADGYIITYKDFSIAKCKYGSEKTIKVKGGSKTSYTDKNVPANISREYCVSAYYEGFEGVGSGSEGAGYLSEQPKIKSLSVSGSGIKLKFGSVKYGEEFVVYRKAPGEKSWKKIGTTSSKYYTDYNVKKGKKYYYTVKSRCNYTGTNIYSVYNTTGWSITYIP